MQVPIGDVWDMLAACAPTYKKRMNQSKDWWIVDYNGKTAALPAGPHGKRTNRTPVHWSKVKNLISTFGLDPASVREHFPNYWTEREKAEKAAGPKTKGQ